jgi:hypothetical protein
MDPALNRYVQRLWRVRSHQPRFTRLVCRVIINSAAASLHFDPPWKTFGDAEGGSDGGDSNDSVAGGGGKGCVPQLTRGLARAAECNISGGRELRGYRRQTSGFPARTCTPTVTKLKSGLQKVRSCS